MLAELVTELGLSSSPDARESTAWSDFLLWEKTRGVQNGISRARSSATIHLLAVASGSLIFLIRQKGLIKVDEPPWSERRENGPLSIQKPPNPHGCAITFTHRDAHEEPKESLVTVINSIG
ncbi:hypothetical protein KC19_VG309600 [Ceratodon purpureus]|uniref:Uncharacterized protein n=1 Tax=Ceratodon purpureus TaxID=3225 RepID=A0A8T0HX87_CERPU|nr:hypothetical protein KC19_VG309600 [Ceratodon purpureus]